MAEADSQSTLCMFDTRYGKRLLDSDILFDTVPTQAPVISDHACHRSFLYFCGAAQALDLDFLPITWQPQRGLVGQGGTSRIHQSLINAELSFAFKAIDTSTPSQERTARESETLYSMLMKEIQWMGNPSIQVAENIHRVDGICWNLNTLGGTVEPVLLYQKTNHGDMHRFMTSGMGKAMDIQTRIKMCRDVAMGLQTLHACNIIHGDIKPQNILLVEFEDGSVHPQVADFGYSIIWTNQGQAATMAYTVPWQAPEIQMKRCKLTPDEAISTDIFSFGMLCLWVIFRHDIAARFNTTPEFAENIGNPRNCPGLAFRTIENLKIQDGLRDFCHDVIENLTLERAQKTTLYKVFELTLCPDPIARTSSFATLWTYLNESLMPTLRAQSNLLNSPVTVVANQDQHYDFKIAESMIQLVKVDIRVRKYIAAALIAQAKYATCAACRSNAAFQASVCLKLGFGIPGNDTLSQELLRKSGKSHAELDQQIRRISQWSQTEEPYLYHTIYLNNLYGFGYLANIDFLDVYTSKASLKAVRESYQQELDDISACLGHDCDILVGLKLVYASFLTASGDYEGARTIEEGALQYFLANSAFGIDHPDTQVLMGALVETYRTQGNLELAAQYCQEVKTRRINLFGPEHPMTLASCLSEARLLRETGSLEEAEAKYRDLISKQRLVFGELHEATINTISDLGTLYIDTVRYDESVKLLEEALALNEKLFGPNHYSTITSLNNLAAVYIDQEDDLDTAQTLLDRARFRFRLAVGDEHPISCNILVNCGTLYMKLGMHEDSLACYDQALAGLERALGSDHPQTIDAVYAKAVLLSQMATEPDHTIELFQRCIRVRESIFGDDHPAVLIALQDYSLCLLQNQRLAEAETAYRTLLQRQVDHLGEDHPALIETLANLGQILSEVGHEDAERILRRAEKLATIAEEGDGPLSQPCIRNLLRHLHQTGTHLDEAERLCQRVLIYERANSDKESTEVYQALDELATVRFDMGKLPEAEETQRELVELGKTLAGVEDVDRLEAVATLAAILHKQGKYQDAQDCYEECINGMVSLNNGHEVRILKLSARRAWSLEQGGSSSEARSLVLDVLRESEGSFGALHPATLEIRAVAAAIYFHQGDKASAVKLNHEVVEGCRSVYGAGHAKTRAADVNHAVYTKQH